VTVRLDEAPLRDGILSEPERKVGDACSGGHAPPTGACRDLRRTRPRAP
jgi:hypothetical protein